MKQVIKRFISIISPENHWKRKEYMVVDCSKYRDNWGGLFDSTKIVAYKTDEFETLEEAKEFIDRSISKEEQSHVQIYKLLFN